MSRPRSNEPNKIVYPKEDSVTVTVKETPVADARKEEELPNVPTLSSQSAAEVALGRASYLKGLESATPKPDPEPEVDDPDVE